MIIKYYKERRYGNNLNLVKYKNKNKLKIKKLKYLKKNLNSYSNVEKKSIQNIL